MTTFPKIDLVLIGSNPTGKTWSFGQAIFSDGRPEALSRILQENLPSSNADSWLFWDGSLGWPEEEVLKRLMEQPAGVCHAGLLLGLSGQPPIIDFISPTWMLNRDPDTDKEATSWRMSLRASLIRTDVLRKMGGPSPEFQTLEGASLEIGHRYITRGVFMRHVPDLLPTMTTFPSREIPFSDELRFAYLRFGRKWSFWALMRCGMTGYRRWSEILSNIRKIFTISLYPEPPPFKQQQSSFAIPEPHPRVSVLIPTLNRYSYLVRILGQFRQQTIRPFEIIVVDQTALDHRDQRIPHKFYDLPLKMIYLDHTGQCSARNAGLKVASGEYVLFLDDDDEIHPGLIEAHLATLDQFKIPVSSGVAHEDGAGPLPENFKLLRSSDVFPTNNTLIKREILERSGIFDLAYDHGSRADGDLGMRVYLSGASMVLNPAIVVRHHRAPQGGLRTHRARIITYAKSRSSIFSRHLPSITEIYFAKRYFTPVQVREELWLQAVGTFAIRGGFFRRFLKIIVGLICLPHTLWEIGRRIQRANQMMGSFPKIPTLLDTHAN